uniref:Interleukin-2 receptor subunit beta N-terminal domain-containing protein n=1 Tax=Oryzias latipes TaxID=8090 RepID=A0A3P9KGJ7_ORYLA
MTEMEKIKGFMSLLLPLLFLQISIASTSHCSPHSDHLDKNFSCYSDLNSTITCVWNSTSVSNHKDSVCRIYTKSPISPLNASCVLEPVDFTKPAIKRCSMIFKRSFSFLSHEKYSIFLNCSSPTKTETKLFKPFCHAKVKAPGKPSINATTVSWLSHVPRHIILNYFSSQLEWKLQKQSWGDPLVKKKTLNCGQECEGQLDPEMLTQGETYEARVRVRANRSNVEGIWSEWSPTLIWVSSEGRPKPPSGTSMGVWNIAIPGAVAFVLISFAAFLSKENIIRIYVAKKIIGPWIPNPSKAASLHKWSSLLFTSESLDCCLKEEEIASLELSFPVKAVQPIRPEEKILEENFNCESSSSGFSNPSYSALCPPPPPLFSQTSRDLLLCTPLGPAQVQKETRKTEKDNETIREAREEILKFLLKDSTNITTMQISDYEKVDHLRQQSVDSGTCSFEEVSQAEAETDSFTLMDGVEERTLLKKEWGKEIDGTMDFLRLIGSSENDFAKHPIQVCFDYERVSTPHADSPELPSLDSGLNSTVESQQESIEIKDTSTHFPFPCSSPSFPQNNLNFCGSCSSPVLQPLLSHGKLDSLFLVPSNMIIEPSSNGYMPVKQEKS